MLEKSFTFAILKFMIMKLKRIYTLFILTPAIFFVSCVLGNDSELQLSSDPNFVSLTFLRNDSIPGLHTAVFRLAFDEKLNDTIIVNLDSLPFGTRIDSVWPVFHFRSTFYTRLLQLTDEGDSISFILNGNAPNRINDTVNFTLPETWVQNVSADAEHYRTYRVKVNVHQVEPELYVWRELRSQITASAGRNQRAVFFNNRHLFYTENVLHVAEGDNLTAESLWMTRTLNFAPAPDLLKLRNIVEHRQMLYVTDNQNRLYGSNNGEDWNLVNHDLANGGIYNLLFSINNQLWAIVKTNTNEYRLAFSENAEQWTDWGALPERDVARQFPTDNYATLVFSSPVGRPKVVIVGGTDRAGNTIPANWIGQTDLRSGEMIFEPLPVRPNQIPPVRNASLIYYDNKIILFGGLATAGDGISDSIIPLRESRNEGLSWNIPDSASNVRPHNFEVRSYQSVIVNDNNRIFIIGGSNNVRNFSDVWSVKLNRMYWAE